jgi:hypothetical protein
MDRTKFYDRLKGLGEFHCVRDLRRFNHKTKRNPNWNVNQYLSHFGHCKNGAYHHCEFHLKPEPVHQVIYYYKVIEVDGIKIRQRGGRPMNFSGRGRPPRKK